MNWCHKVGLTVDASALSPRWKAVEDYERDLTPNKGLKLVRLFVFRNRDHAFEKEFTEALVKSDNSFPLDDNAELLRVMAGSIIAASLERGPSITAKAVALVLRACDFPKGRSRPAIPEVIQMSHKFLIDQGNLVRPNHFYEWSARSDFAEKIRAVEAESESADSASVSKSMLEVFQSLARLQSKMSLCIEQISEENQILWWLLGEFSYSFNRPFSDFSAGSYALIAADEAAARTTLLPGPGSMETILSRVLRCCKSDTKKRTFRDVLESVDAGWRSNRVKKMNLSVTEDFLPFCTALSKLEEAGKPKIWQPIFAKACPGVPVDTVVEPSSVAIQFYSELLALKVLTSLG